MIPEPERGRNVGQAFMRRRAGAAGGRIRTGRLHRVTTEYPVRLDIPQNIDRDLVRCAPKNTPAEIVDKLNTEINVALADPKMKARLADLGATVLPGSSADFGRLIAEETEKWAKVVKFSGARAD
jgi:hypothetical protein